MHQAFKKAGELMHVFAGDIDPSRRPLYDKRFVLVLQGDDIGFNHRCSTILVALMSSNIDEKRVWEDRLEPTESGLSRPSIVKLQLLQPVPRAVLLKDGEYVRNIPDAALQRIRAHLLVNLGINTGS